MSDEYEYGPWINAPKGSYIEVLRAGELWPMPLDRYRIATPKPKRELVVGKWYRGNGGVWKQCIFAEPNGDGGYFRAALVCADATWRPMTGIDWSTTPRDEAPE